MKDKQVYSNVSNVSNNRRYYLHSKIKDFAKVNAREKEVLITKKTHDNMDKVQKYYIDVIKKIGYNVQLTMDL